ncbi:MAG: tyrosine--tRNA ligase [Lentimicrobiaceae bacterium]|nr:tyrosine--tRNA ligase [Lentimicrobiaceae bacterium]
MNFVDELRWRGMVHDIMPGTEEYVKNGKALAYVGIDPTADSLHIGHLVGIMMLRHFQMAGHQPIVLLGGATGMIGDPSGKSEERNLLDEDVLRHNQECLKRQLLKFLDFNAAENPAIMVNNYDWMRDFSFLGFLREVGKHLTVNYMMSKDSVQKRLETGLSFTEFTYQLVQGYDFLWLYQHHGCRLQMGGSDQWGNIVTGTELIRRKTGGEAYALTCPLITKADGGKFGKTEQGNVWLDAERTSPYAFYQFWLNASDEDAIKWIRIFSLKQRDEIEKLSQAHMEAPHLRILQKVLAEELTVRVHSQQDLETAMEASEILFGKGTEEVLKRLPEEVFLSVFEGVPMCELQREILRDGIPLAAFLSDHTGIFSSRGEVRRMLKDNGIMINKQRPQEESAIGLESLLNDRYILVQKGKKNYYLVKVV